MRRRELGLDPCELKFRSWVPPSPWSSHSVFVSDLQLAFHKKMLRNPYFNRNSSRTLSEQTFRESVDNNDRPPRRVRRNSQSHRQCSFGGAVDDGNTLLVIAVACLIDPQTRAGYHTATVRMPCHSIPSAICSGSRPLARATGRRSAAWSTAARRAFRLSEADIQPYLDKRRPGQSRHTTQRQELDAVRILSGVFTDEATGKQVTTGTPIALLIDNVDARSKDYSDIKDKYRPAHADYTYDVKYGIRDYRGGGRQSARETATRVAAGAIARKIVPGMNVRGALVQMGKRSIDRARWDWAEVDKNPFFCPDAKTAAELADYLDGVRKAGSSVGAVIEIVADGVPAGLGAPIYGKLDGDLAAALMGINAVKGVEIGAGFGAAALSGEENADDMRMDRKEQRRQAAISVQQRRRHPRRNFHRPIGGGALCGQADLVDPDAAQDRRPLRQRNRDRDQGPSRPMRRHPRRPDRRSHGGMRDRGSLSASPRPDGRRPGLAVPKTGKLEGSVQDGHHRVEATIAAFTRGEIVVVTDDDDRENEGDLFVAASLCTPEKMAFIIRNTSGIVCAPLARRRRQASASRSDGGAQRCPARHRVHRFGRLPARAHHRHFRGRALQYRARARQRQQRGERFRAPRPCLSAGRARRRRADALRSHRSLRRSVPPCGIAGGGRAGGADERQRHA